MIFLYSFLVCGIFCMISQIILDNFKITPGHVTALFTAFGVILSFLGIYEKLIKMAGAGATILISNFGYMLYTGAFEGLKDNGVVGLFSNMLTYSSLAITSAVVFAFIFTLIFKPKN